MENGTYYTQTSGEALPPGTILFQRYRIEKVLGQGGFGITYVASDFQTQTLMAIKELFPSGYVTRGPDHRTLYPCSGKENSIAYLRHRFEQEAQVLMQLQGRDGVIRVTHFFSENNSVYYVMELLVGEDLSHRLNSKGVIPWSQFAPILLQVMAALEQIHNAGLIHRDISPDNIFLTNSGSVRLIDFGSVRAYQGSDHFTALIKHGFAPWEQYLTNGRQGPWTDIYSLCVTAYFALSGRKPPRATERRMQDAIIPLETLVPGIPPQVCRVLHKGMAVQMEDRFQNVSQLRAALMSCGPIGSATPMYPPGTLVCLSGTMAGRCWQLAPGGVLRIGRSPECDVVYPSNSPGISRNQCMVARASDGQLLVRDEGSSCGTMLFGQGQAMRLSPNIWQPLNGMHIRFGQQEEYAETGR